MKVSMNTGYNRAYEITTGITDYTLRGIFIDQVTRKLMEIGRDMTDKQKRASHEYAYWEYCLNLAKAEQRIAWLTRWFERTDFDDLT